MGYLRSFLVTTSLLISHSIWAQIIIFPGDNSISSIDENIRVEGQRNSKARSINYKVLRTWTIYSTKEETLHCGLIKSVDIPYITVNNEKVKICYCLSKCYNPEDAVHKERDILKKNDFIKRGHHKEYVKVDMANNSYRTFSKSEIGTLDIILKKGANKIQYEHLVKGGGDLFHRSSIPLHIFGLDFYDHSLMAKTKIKVDVRILPEPKFIDYFINNTLQDSTEENTLSIPHNFFSNSNARSGVQKVQLLFKYSYKPKWLPKVTDAISLILALSFGLYVSFYFGRIKESVLSKILRISLIPIFATLLSLIFKIILYLILGLQTNFFLGLIWGPSSVSLVVYYSSLLVLFLLTAAVAHRKFSNG